MIGWTPSQKQRLRELNAGLDLQEKLFASARERDTNFPLIEHPLCVRSLERLRKVRESRSRPKLRRLESRLVGALLKSGFVEVVTPILIARGSLEKMSIGEDHDLARQVFWVDRDRCLRPMLAPNLYFLLRELAGVWDRPIRIFEVGPCFRRDSAGRHHLNEFTMLNLVELGLPEETKSRRFEELAGLVMKAAGIREYELGRHPSDVYGETIDIHSSIELASGVIGPHSLDERWGISDNWVGLGLGLERLIMVREGYQNIQRAGRALVYLDGTRLNIYNRRP
jgi:phenylalanyl-tRNA synthetase alpha chain